MQTPFEQAGRFIGHTVPQPPQFFGSVSGFDSQPSAVSLLQSTKGALQVTEQLPIAQVAVPFGCGPPQGLLQAPQWMRSLSMDVSQPLPKFLSQSPKFWLQE